MPKNYRCCQIESCGSGRLLRRVFGLSITHLPLGCKLPNYQIPFDFQHLSIAAEYRVLVPNIEGSKKRGIGVDTQ